MIDIESVLRVIGEAPADAPIAVDTETTGLRPYQGDVIRGVSLAVGAASWYLPISHPQTDNLPRQVVWDVLTKVRAHGNLVFHHSKFDAAFLAQVCPGDWLAGHLDTKVGAWLEDEALVNGLKERASMIFGHDAAVEKRALKALERGLTLKELSDLYYGQGPKITRKEAEALARTDPRREKRGWADFTGAEIEAYARQDAVLTLRLHEYQLGCPEAALIDRARPRELRFQSVLFGMERTGIRTDVTQVEVERAKAMTRAEELETELDIGEVNLRSPVQVAELVYDRWGLECRDWTPTGNRSTGREAMSVLATTDPRVAGLMEFRRLAKAVDAYFGPLLDRLDSEGRVHPSFFSTRTKTGRLSCQAPNLQTIPREDVLGTVRRCFVPAEGYELVEFDLSQAEVRWSAALAKEPGMIAAYREQRDLYQEVADGLGCDRQTAKRLTLSYQYGAGTTKLARILIAGQGRRLRRSDILRAEDLSMGFRKLYPRLAHAMGYFEKRADADGRLPMGWPGRVRRFHHVLPGPAGRWFDEEGRKGLNSLCQGGVGEFMKDLMVESVTVFEELGARLLLQVHDSLVCEVLPGTDQELHRRLQKLIDELNPHSVVPQVLEVKPWAA